MNRGGKSLPCSAPRLQKLRANNAAMRPPSAHKDGKGIEENIMKNKKGIYMKYSKPKDGDTKRVDGNLYIYRTRGNWSAWIFICGPEVL